MKFENGAVVMTDTDTGKPYARVLSAWELNLVLSQLQALDGETLNAREVVPFILRTPNVSEEKARRIAEKQAGLHHLAGHGTQALIDMAINARLPASLVHAVETFEHGGTTRAVVGRHKISADNLPKGAPVSKCEHEWIASEGRTASGWLCRKCGGYDGPQANDKALCYQCGQETRQRLVGDEWHCKACDALQCERVVCEWCLRVCTRPGGEHLCGGKHAK
jgi:hypothetical protein